MTTSVRSANGLSKHAGQVVDAVMRACAADYGGRFPCRLGPAVAEAERRPLRGAGLLHLRRPAKHPRDGNGDGGA